MPKHRDTLHLLELARQAQGLLSAPGASIAPAVGACATISEACGTMDEKKWLSFEMNGYGGKAPTTIGKKLQAKRNEALANRILRYRHHSGTWFLRMGTHIERLPFPHFFIESVAELERRARSAGTADVSGVELSITDERLLRVELVRALRGVGIPPVPFKAVFPSTIYKDILEGLRSELQEYLMRASAQLATEVLERAASESASSAAPGAPAIVVHAGPGASVQVVANSGISQAGTFNAVTPVSPTTSESIATIREQIAALEDLLIGSRKDHLAIQDNLETIKAMMNVVLDGIEAGLASRPTASADEIRALAAEVVAVTTKDGKISLDTLKSLFGFGMAQNLLASTVFEAIRRALELLQ